MAENDWIIGLTAGLDKNKSRVQIKKDIAELQKAINKFELQAVLDVKTKENLEDQLSNIKIALTDVSFSDSAINKLIDQINSALSTINISGLNIKDSDGIVHHLDEVRKASSKVAAEEEKTLERMAKVREKTELTRKSEEKRQQLAQNNAINKALEEEYAEREKLAEQVKTILEKTGDKGKTTTDIQLLRDNFTKLGLSADEVKNKMSEVDKEIDILNNTIATGDNNAIVSQFDKVNAVLSQTKNDLASTKSELSKVKSEINSVNREQKLNINISGLESKIANLQRISPEIANFKTQINGAEVSIESLLEDLSKVNSQSDFSVVSAKFRTFTNAAKSAGIATSEFSSIIKTQLTQVENAFKQTFSIAAVGIIAISKTKEAIKELKEVNTYLTEISKANDKLTAAELKSIGNNSFDVASKYGKKATDYLSGVQESSRAGYVNAEEIAELSVAAQGAGDMTAELANKYIIATDKAYKLGGSVEKLTEILDGSNYITNHNAVNMTELAEGMSIVGSQAASLGVQADETTSVLGTMIATTQQSGSEMARAFRAILLNLQQVTDEEEGIDAEGLTKYEKACEALNVSLKETKNGVTSLRAPMEVLKELSVEYSKLDSNDIKRTNLLSSVGGKLRANALNAILENFDMYEKMLEQYSQGTGSMAIEAEKTANSWEGSLNRLSNTWTDTVENVANSDAIITAINGLNGILSVANNITDALGSWGTIGLGAGIATSIKNVGRVKKYTLFCFENADYNMCSLGY